MTSPSDDDELRAQALLDADVAEDLDLERAMEELEAATEAALANQTATHSPPKTAAAAAATPAKTNTPTRKQEATKEERDSTPTRSTPSPPTAAALSPTAAPSSPAHQSTATTAPAPAVAAIPAPAPSSAPTASISVMPSLSSSTNFSNRPVLPTASPLRSSLTLLAQSGANGEGGGGPDVAALLRQLSASDRLISDLNRDNARAHQQIKIMEAREKNQSHFRTEEVHQLQAQLQEKEEELVRLRAAAQEALIDPQARDQLSRMQHQLDTEREKHHQEVATLRHELDKLRQVKVDQAMAQDAQAHAGREGLRLTLEALQEKYNALKLQKDTEVKELHSKLVWYIENQSLLTDLQEQLREAKAKVEQLTDENILMTHLLPQGTRLETGMLVKVKARPQDAKRIKELEARVQELSEIIRKKHRVQHAAATGAGGGGGSGGITGSSTGRPVGSALAGMLAAIKPSMEENDLIRTLRGRIQELEAELRGADEKMAVELRSLRQQSDQMKLLYEKRINKLNKELADTQKRIPLTGRNKVNRIKELENSVSELREFYGNKIKKMNLIIHKLRRGERVEEKEVQDVQEKEEQEGGEEATTGNQGDKEAATQDTSGSTGDGSQPPAPSHDSTPLPTSSAGPDPNSTLESDQLPRASLAPPPHPHPQPHPYAHPHAPPAPPPAFLHYDYPHQSPSRDLLLLKQSLLESHEKELHLLTSKYEAQLESMKHQWEAQLTLIRGTHEADSKLQRALLQQAQEECTRIRATLQQEMSQRQRLQERCLELESSLQRAQNAPGYVDFQQLQQRLEQLTQQAEKREQEYEAASHETLEGIKAERAGWEDKLRRKQEQLIRTQTQLEQLQARMQQMGEKMEEMRQVIQWQQKQQEQQQEQQQQQIRSPDQRRTGTAPSSSTSPPSHQRPPHPSLPPPSLPSHLYPSYPPFFSSYYRELQPGADRDVNSLWLEEDLAVNVSVHELEQQQRGAAYEHRMGEARTDAGAGRVEEEEDDIAHLLSPRSSSKFRSLSRSGSSSVAGSSKRTYAPQLPDDLELKWKYVMGTDMKSV